jgi:uncharacterized damage-inducible protein DinB
MTTMEQMTKQYRLLTDWYLSVLEDIKPEDGSKVISQNTNSLEWLAGHLLVTRCRNILRLGQTVEPYQHLDTFVDQTLPPPNFRAFDPNKKYPRLAECAENWSNYSKIFVDTLESVDDRVLKTQIPLSGPTGGNTVEDLLTSVVLHEAFHIGQMSIIRKALGYKAMYWFHR